MATRRIRSRSSRRASRSSRRKRGQFVSSKLPEKFTYRGYTVALVKEPSGALFRAKRGSHTITIATPQRASKGEYVKLLKEQIDRSIELNQSLRH